MVVSIRKANQILAVLADKYSTEIKLMSVRSKPFETLISTILSAQTTDAQVDKISPNLFKKYPTPLVMSKARLKSIEKIIKSVGLYKTKAKNIVAASKKLVSDFGGDVPLTRDELMKLDGVGRKTANVVLIKAFGEPAVPVDTHVFRVAKRLSLSGGNKVEDVERDLMNLISPKKQAIAHFALITHGRNICLARNPMCDICPVLSMCDYGKNHLKG